MLELDIVKKAKKHFTYLFESKRKLTMRALLDQNACWFQFADAVEAKKSVTFGAFVRFCRHLVAYDAMQYVSIHINL